MARSNGIASIARRYQDAGLQVIPIRTDGSKAPACAEWRKYQSPECRPDIDSLFGRQVGVAVLCGKASGNLEVIDFDEVGLFDSFAEVVEQ